MRQVSVEQAEGLVLCHDITRIVPGQFKGRAFKKGHAIRAGDIPALLDLGKKHLYVYEPQPGSIHEDPAAQKIARAVAGENVYLSETSEGRVNLIAGISGLLKVNPQAVAHINTCGDVVLATLHTHQSVEADTPVAGTRIIPLFTEKTRVEAVTDICRKEGPVVDVIPFRSLKTGIVTTGSEIYSGRIKDQFGPILYEKFRALNCTVIDQRFVSDEIDLTVSAIIDLINNGAELVAVTGGMSVDPDDQTPAAIRATGAHVTAYGAPAFPGAMFMLADLDGIPIVGLPGCVMYYRASIFDLILPRIVAGDIITADEIAALGHGGFCLGCTTCRYPRCGFGKGA